MLTYALTNIIYRIFNIEFAIIKVCVCIHTHLKTITKMVKNIIKNYKIKKHTAIMIMKFKIKFSTLFVIFSLH